MRFVPSVGLLLGLAASTAAAASSHAGHCQVRVCTDRLIRELVRPLACCCPLRARLLTTHISARTQHKHKHQHQHPIAQAGAAEGRILVQDRFLDDSNRAALLCRARFQSVEPVPGTCRRRLAVPSWFSNSLSSVLGHAMPKSQDAGEVLLPITEVVGDHAEHQDVHVSGAGKGGLADGNVGVVYLEGDGDFVLTDTATGAEHRVPIEPGKLISWPNAGFLHRVEGASPRIRRHMLGPVAFDAASNGLVGVGYATKECADLAGYECVTPEPVTLASFVGSTGEACVYQCDEFYDDAFTHVWIGFNNQTNTCSCMASACTGFVPAPTYEYWVPEVSEFAGYSHTPLMFGGIIWPTSHSRSHSSISSDLATFDPNKPLQDFECPPLVLAATDPIQIAATSHKNKATVGRGKFYSLRVTLTMPALMLDRRLVEGEQDERELKGGNTANKKPANTTDYALLVTVPAGGAANVVYKRTSARPGLKPAALKRPAVQENGDLLWARIPMPQYTSKAYTRTFKVMRRARGMKGGMCAGVGSRRGAV